MKKEKKREKMSINSGHFFLFNLHNQTLIEKSVSMMAAVVATETFSSRLIGGGLSSSERKR